MPRLSGYVQLLADVRARQRRQLWQVGILLGLAAATALVVLAGFAAGWSVVLGRALAIAAPIALAAVACFFGVYRAVATVRGDLRTARLVGERVPELSMDVLSAVEVERELAGLRDADLRGFSPVLAREHLRRMDERSRQVDVRRVVDPRGVKRAAQALGAVAVLAIAVLALGYARWSSGYLAVVTPSVRSDAASQREPITGDIELTYRYPAYTGLANRTVSGTNGEISGPAGTEVQIRTRSDRPVERAELSVNGARVPLAVKGERDLSGSLVLSKSGVYSFVFLTSSDREVARGPDVPLRVEADAPPQVTIKVPAEQLEIDPGQKVLVRYEASDDYGLTSVELVYRLPHQTQDVRIPLPHDSGRRSTGSYTWDLGTVRLAPGDRITYYVEARDNDAAAGKKRGASRTQVLHVYSAAEHRREADKRVQALWERLVTLLADRMEGPDRSDDKDAQRVQSQQSVDQTALELVSELTRVARELAGQRDAPTPLVAALLNVTDGLHPRVLTTTQARRQFMRFTHGGAADALLSRRITVAVEDEIHELERDVLYLEALLDREKLIELRELASQLTQERRDLASLVQEFKKTQDPMVREQILQQIQQLRSRIDELMQRMSELAKGIRDEHLNAEALQDMMKQQDLRSELDEIQKLIQEGKADEALKRLEQMSLDMDRMMQNLDRAENNLGGEEFSELSQKFQDFMSELKKTSEAQQKLADQTREIRDRYKEKMRDRLKQRAQSLRDQLLKDADDLQKDYGALQPTELNQSADKSLEEAQAQLDNLKKALQVDDYDLAAEAAEHVDEAAEQLSQLGEQQRGLEELLDHPAALRQRSERISKQLAKDAEKASDMSRKLQQLFPPPGSMMSEQDKARMKQLGAEQRQLQRRADGLKQQMEQMQQLAPVFGGDVMQQMDQVGEHMGEAAERVEGRDPGRGYGEQRAALDQLGEFEQRMKDQQKQGGKGGIPLPMMSQRGSGNGQSHEKVEIPDEDQYQAPKEFRKDLLDAMKQGAPDKYKEQVKRYYEELVR